ncbi:MAG: carbohydrate ABC transporter permease [Candidatus Faecivicinus sp.]|nr:carbohydrate ABC transporter permease [Candidatus Faecivicinus sp.]
MIKRYKSAENTIFDTVVMILLVLSGLICLLPLLHVIALSLSSKGAALAGRVYLLPVELTTTAYTTLLKDNRFMQATLVSLERVLLGGAINFVLTIMTAYPLSLESRQFPARRIYIWIFVFAMLFGASLVPWYFVINATGIKNSIWALVLPGGLPVYNMILLLNFFRSEPRDIKEAATIDGVNPFQMMIRIYVPLAMPAIATVTVFSIVNHWNNFFDGLLLISSPEKIPLQTYIQTLTNTNITVTSSSITQEELEALTSLKTFNAAKIVVAAIPIALFYPFMQRFFVSGITLGSVKG